MLNISSMQKDSIDSIAIGRFDGLHLGHQKLFDALTLNGAILVIDTGRANLTPSNYLSFFTKWPYYIYKLDDIKHYDAAGFIALLKKDFPALKKIVVGLDFRFGHNRAYGVDDLLLLFKECEVIDEYKIDDIGVHSRYIRSLLMDGHVDIAAKMLGRNYMIFGQTIKGQGIGAKELYPTVNMKCDDFFLPSEGVYATRFFSAGNFHKSVSFLGHRVTTDGNYAIETNILEDNFLVNDVIGIEFVQRLRGNIFFDKFDDLRRQIGIDIIDAKKVFERT